MNLLVDIGNSRIKWAFQDADGGIGETHSLDRGPEQGHVLPLAVQQAWKALPIPKRVLISNVAGRGYGSAVFRWVMETWAIEAEFVSVSQGLFGVELAYANPERFGVDRWLTLLAAKQLASGPVCVVDCGTAATVDVLDTSGRHEGGIILPGLQLMQRCLIQKSEGIAQGIAGLKAIKNEILGRDTQSGIEKGSLYAVAGAINQCVAEVELALEGPTTRFITGGDAPTILKELAGEWRHVPELVLQGLGWIATNG